MIIEALLISMLMMVSAGFSAITGFGTSTISIPILLFFFPLPQAVLFVGIIRLIGTIWKMILFRSEFLWRLIIIVVVPAIFASILGAQTLLHYSDYLSKRVLGVFLLVYVMLLFFRPHFKLSQKSSIAIGGGVLTGFSAGIFGISGPVQSAFLSAFNLPKVQYIFTIAFLDCLVDVSRLSSYLIGGISMMPIFLLALVFSIPAIFFGALFARKIVDGIPQIYFRSIILLFLSIVTLRWLIWG